jgi:hypothetical protein
LASSAAHSDEQAPRPYRIGFAQRWRVRRLGRLDGRHAVPDPTSTPPPLTTRARKAFDADFADAAEGLWVRHLEEIEGHGRELARLDGQLTSMRSALQEARSELAHRQAAGPNPDAPVRKPGEADAPIELVRARRMREHQRSVDAARQRYERASEAVAAAEAQHAFLNAEIADRREITVARTWRLHATSRRIRAIYDGALLRRHPQHALVRAALDLSGPPLPDWAADDGPGR